ncbi:O-antigen polymerase [Roseovarius sp.]|uniref:O-antigen polymerase n=1 Tax=Roseovarius sp. TaxID=1486281 RepID=UPI003BABAEA7
MLTFVLLLAIVMLYAMLFRVAGGRSIVFIAAILQATFYIPILFLVDVNDHLELKFLLVHQTFFISFLSFAILFSAKLSDSQFSTPQILLDKRRYFIWNAFYFTVSIIVSGAFFMATGGLIFSRIAFVDDVAGLRLSFYASGDSGAGYVNQFRNILLPVTIGAISFFLDRKLRLFFLIFAIPAALVLLTGTGQRFPLVFAATYAFVTFVVLRGVRLNFRVIFLSVMFLFVFGYLSSLLGRADASFLSSVVHIIERVFSVNQSSNIATFFYLDQRGMVYGKDWVEDLVGISPFARPSTIANELFSVLYGSSRGSSPPSLASSAFYNFHAFGLFLIPALLAFSLAWIARKLHGKVIHASKFLALIFLGLVIGSWTTGGINTLLNRGFLAILLYLFSLRLVLHTRAPSQKGRQHRERSVSG